MPDSPPSSPLHASHICRSTCILALRLDYCAPHESADKIGKTAIRTILGPAYAKVKKAPKVADEEEAKALLSKILPK